MEPLDQGFNRLAWFLPYAFGLIGLGLVVFVARRWSTLSAEAAAGGREPASRPDADDPLSTRLDDELRDLD